MNCGLPQHPGEMKNVPAREKATAPTFIEPEFTLGQSAGPSYGLGTTSLQPLKTTQHSHGSSMLSGGLGTGQDRTCSGRSATLPHILQQVTSISNPPPPTQGTE